MIKLASHLGKDGACVIECKVELTALIEVVVAQSWFWFNLYLLAASRLLSAVKLEAQIDRLARLLRKWLNYKVSWDLTLP